MNVLSRYLKLVAPAVAWAAAGCAQSVVPNTTVPDTAENREVVAFMERYRSAVERRDAVALEALLSRDYFDDMGTAPGGDDMDYEALREGLGRLKEQVLEARYSISYRNVTFARDRAWVEIVYAGWFKLKDGGDGKPNWVRRVSPHRLALVKERGGYRIASGI